jgi:dTDP-glucose pyrophosphorylase
MPLCVPKNRFQAQPLLTQTRLLELILILTLKQTLLFVKQVDQPEAYVVKLNDANEIVELVENRKTSSVI